MKKGLALLVLMMLVFSVVLVAGCGEKKTTVKIGDEEITIDEDDIKELEKQMEEEGWVEEDSDDSGSVTWEGQEPTEAEMGAPLYPGAKYVSGTGVVNQDLGDSTVTGASFSTSDDYSKVVDWYTGKLGSPDITDSESSSWMKIDENSMITITVTDAGSKVTIDIGNVATK